MKSFELLGFFFLLIVIVSTLIFSLMVSGFLAIKTLNYFFTPKTMLPNIFSILYIWGWLFSAWFFSYTVSNWAYEDCFPNFLKKKKKQGLEVFE